MKRLLLLLITSSCVLYLSNLLLQYPSITWLEDYSTDSETFRSQDFGENNLNKIEKFSTTYQLDFYKALTVFMAGSNCHLSSSFTPDYASYLYIYHLLEEQRKIQYQKLENAYQTILQDLQCFPIPANYETKALEIAYEDSFGEARTYGGNRKHEGTDLMALNNTSGYYPVVSMTDGVVENIGWLEQGGWRIGIRAPSGGYFYYAHLSDYFKDFEKGQEVQAGEILGFMGDTGYSKVEGTTGNFDVHLHLGIYIQTDLSDEVSVNPYYILRYLENKLLYYHYTQLGGES
jgi:murein DD-endopeptidase MepM/ murein hydrolase activator NlpD